MVLTQPQTCKGPEATPRTPPAARGRGCSRTEPLPATKLHIPAPTPALVPRRRLHAALAEGLSRPLTLLAAPAGWGKTTLLSEWMRRPERAGGGWPGSRLTRATTTRCASGRACSAALQGARPGVSDERAGAARLPPPAPAGGGRDRPPQRAGRAPRRDRPRPRRLPRGRGRAGAPVADLPAGAPPRALPPGDRDARRPPAAAGPSAGAGGAGGAAGRRPALHARGGPRPT